MFFICLSLADVAHSACLVRDCVVDVLDVSGELANDPDALTTQVEDLQSEGDDMETEETEIMEAEKEELKQEVAQCRPAKSMNADSGDHGHAAGVERPTPLSGRSEPIR